MLTVYLGSNAEISQPLVNVGRKELDFGQGFYITTIKEQAIKWSRRICIVRRVNPPIINKYNFDLDSAVAKGFRIKTLCEYNKEWLDFIVSSRRGERPWSEYDIIEGGVANDDVIDTVEDYYVGRITAEQALGQLKFAKPTNQICINKQIIVDRFLTYIGSERI